VVILLPGGAAASDDFISGPQGQRTLILLQPPLLPSALNAFEAVCSLCP